MYFREFIKDKNVILDWAMSTELLKNGFIKG